MAKQFLYRSYKNRFRDIPAIMDHMQELQTELRRTDLANLQFFNITYFIITKNVFAKTGSGYFSEEATLKALDINFARYYFDALKQYCIGQKTTPAWEVMFDFCKKDNSLPLIYLALGVNAHVNNDLGLSLFDVVKETDFKTDFDRVNPVIYNSLDEVIDETRLNGFYKPFMKLLIRHWRYNAWKNYQGLRDKTKLKSHIEMTAKIMAQELTKVHSVTDFYHLYKII